MPRIAGECELEQLYKRRAMVGELIEQLEEYGRCSRQALVTPHRKLHMVGEPSSCRPAGAVEEALAPRVLLVTPEPVVAEGIRCVLAGSGLRLAAVCAAMPEALRECALLPPDLVVLHLDTRGLLDHIAALREQAPRCAIVLLADKLSIETVGRALALGARGILSTKLLAPVVVRSLQAIAAGEIQVSLPSVAEVPLHRDVHLTPRQQVLLPLLGQGLKNKEIATVMGTTERTVKSYLSRLFKVLGASDRFEAGRYALEMLAAGDGQAPAAYAAGAAIPPPGAPCYTMVGSESRQERSAPWPSKARPDGTSSSAPCSPEPFRLEASAASAR